jgi:energy-coupling factor transporter transmembrane protein EcfT
MKQKLYKIILKIIVFLPLGIIYQAVFFGFKRSLFDLIFFGLIVSSIIVFYNWFSYEKFDDIETQDFMESTHKSSIENTMINWENIINILKQQLVETKIIFEKENEIKIQIERRFIDAILLIEKIDDKINLTISNKMFSLFSDNARNYKFLKSFITKLEIKSPQPTAGS